MTCGMEHAVQNLLERWAARQGMEPGASLFPAIDAVNEAFDSGISPCVACDEAFLGFIEEYLGYFSCEVIWNLKSASNEDEA